MIGDPDHLVHGVKTLNNQVNALQCTYLTVVLLTIFQITKL